ncbi:MAG: ATP-binding protein [Actinomycetota bacterium]
MDLRWKMMLPLTLLTLLWAGTGTYLLTRTRVTESQVGVGLELQRQVVKAQGLYSDLVINQVELVRFAANTQGVSAAVVASDKTTLDGLLRPLLLASRAEVLVVLDRSGAELVTLWRDGNQIDFGPSGLSQDVRGQINAESNGSLLDKTVVITASARGAVLLAAGAVRDVKGSVGSLGVGSRVNSLTEKLTSKEFDEAGGQFALYDGLGRYVASTGRVPKLRALTIGKPMSSYSTIGDQPFLMGNLPGRDGKVPGRVAAFLPPDSVYGPVKRTAKLIGGLGLLALFGVIGLGLVLARAITRPLHRVAEVARAIAHGDLSTRADVRQGDEIGILGEAFNEMAIKLQASYEELEQRVEERTEELRAANKQLARVGQAKSDFLANMSHELRTPLNAIIGYSELMSDPFFGTPKPADVRKHSKAIQASGQHLLGLINDILDLSKIEAGKLVLYCENVPVRKVFRDVVEVMQPMARAKSINLKAKLSKAPDFVRADEKRLRQILLNLVSNAIKFTPDGGSVTVSATNGDGSLHASVEDTGIGVAREFQDRVFEQFLQVDGSYARKQEGTGLGLALTKRLVELHGGSVGLMSEEGVGSTFTFDVPVGATQNNGKETR